MPEQQVVANTVLDEIGWNNAYAIPVANAENKRLEDELLNLNRQLLQVQGKLCQDEDRVEALFEHLKNVRTELGHTHGLFEAQVKVRETEDHLRKVAGRETGRIQQELNKLDKDLQDQKEKKNFFENTIFRGTQRLDEKKAQMNWDNQALDAWLKECKRRDDDAMTLAKYTREDDDKIREITFKINSMTDELAKKRRQLDLENMETQTAQVELDKTAEEFRKAHVERQELLHRWEQTIDQMARRDDEMNILALEFEQTKVEVRSKEILRKEKLQFLIDAKGNNQDAENRVKKSERDIAAVKMQYQQAEKERNEMQSSLETLKRTTDRTNSDLEVARTEVTALKQDFVDKKKKLENALATVKTLQQKLTQTQKSKLSAEEQNAHLEQLLQQEEQGVTAMNAELKQLRETHYARTQDIAKLKSDVKRLEVEIQGTQSTIGNLNSKIRDKDKEILRQEEMIYSYDLNIQAAQRSVSLMEGEQSNDEKVALEARTRELNRILREKVSIQNLLSAENKRQQDEVRKVKRHLESSVVSREDLKRKIDELELHIDNAQKVLKKSVNEKQDKMVDKNLLDLRIKKLTEELHRQAGEVLSQEKHRLKLETAMKERRLEINIHTKMIAAQLRDAEDQRRETGMQLQERITRIEKLRKRYENIIVVMGPPEGEEERSQAYYVIRAAQEKEDLQRTGDELDARIRKAEKEICALKNTVKVMRSSNEVVRRDQTKIMDSADEMQEKHVLEEQLKTVIDKFRHKKGLLRELQEDLQRMTQNLENICHDEETLSNSIEEKEAKILQLKRDLADQLTKLNRVNKLNSKLVREIRSALKLKEAEEEHDIDLRDLRELNKNALKQLAESIDKHPETVLSVQIYFEQAGLPLPAVPGPGSRSSSSSLTSLRSSLFDHGSLSSVRSASSQGSVRSRHSGSASSVKKRPSIATQFTVFGDELIVKPPSRGLSHSSRGSQLTTADRRSSSSKSSDALKEFTIFGDDLIVRGSGQSSMVSSHRSERSLLELDDSHRSRPSLIRSTKSDLRSRISDRSSGSSRSGKEKASPTVRSRVRTDIRASAGPAELSVLRQISARSRRECQTPSTPIEAFTVFGADQLDVRVPSQHSSDSGGSHRNGKC